MLEKELTDSIIATVGVLPGVSTDLVLKVGSTASDAAEAVKKLPIASGNPQLPEGFDYEVFINGRSAEKDSAIKANDVVLLSLVH
jgi:hypothetical protein